MFAIVLEPVLCVLRKSMFRSGKHVNVDVDDSENMEFPRSMLSLKQETSI